MAGYDYSAGMSNNAVAAYQGGLVPASKIKGIPAFLIDEHCRYDEWHHSSKFFNRVKFYDPETVRDTFGLGDPGQADADAVAALARYKAERAAARKDTAVAFHDATTVSWTEFDKGRRGKWIPREESFTGLVRLRGQMVDMLTPRGIVTKKATGANITVDLGKTVTGRTWTMRSNKIERDREAKRLATVAENEKVAAKEAARILDRDQQRAAAALRPKPDVTQGEWRDPATPFPVETENAAYVRQVRLTRLLVNDPAPAMPAILFAAGLSSIPKIRPDGFPRDLFTKVCGLVAV